MSGMILCWKKNYLLSSIIVLFQFSFPSVLQLDGATYPGQVHQSFGGVGRNLADCLARLGNNPLFISVVSDDSHAEAFFSQCNHMVMPL